MSTFLVAWRRGAGLRPNSDVTGKKPFQVQYNLAYYLFICYSPNNTLKVTIGSGEVGTFLDDFYIRIIKPKHV